MDALQKLHDNYTAENASFLFYLHEQEQFDESEFSALCACIASLCQTHAEDRTVAAQICFVYGQVLRHIVYHFDPNDRSKICDLPLEYYEKLNSLESIAARYFSAKPAR